MSDLALQRIAENKKTRNPGLNLSNCGLTKLPAELSECIWLTSLNLCFNEKLDDLLPITTLQNLQKIDFQSTKVNDLTSLSKLDSLQEIDFSSTPVGDLALLSKLTNLEKVSFDNTQIDDLTPLAGLIKLKSIHFDDTQGHLEKPALMRK